MRIVVSNSGKQYAHQLIKALLIDGYQVTFYTLFWYFPQHWFWKLLFSFIPSTLKTKIEKVLLKKYDKELEHPNLTIKTKPLLELIKRIKSKLQTKEGEQSQFWADKAHDKWVAKYIKNLEYDIFIGYEMSSADSFRVSKQKNKINILDLAQIHYQEIDELANEHNSLSHLRIDELRTNINQIKEAEYQLLDYVITLSTFAENSMTKHYIPSSKVAVITLGYNEKVFVPKPKKQKTNNFNLVYAGAIIKRKGIIELKKALDIISQTTDFKVTLTLVGGLVDKDVFSLNEEKYKVIHKPFVPHKQLAQEFQNADLFVFPSLLDSWAMVVLEAMGCGTPVIITENTGAKDAVEQYGGGKIIKAGDIDDLCKALLNYFNNPNLLLQDAEIAANAAAHFTWSTYQNNINTFIKKIRN